MKDINLSDTGTVVKIVAGLCSIVGATAALVLYLATGPELEEDFNTFKQEVYHPHVNDAKEKLAGLEQRLDRAVERDWQKYKMQKERETIKKPEPKRSKKRYTTTTMERRRRKR